MSESERQTMSTSNLSCDDLIAGLPKNIVEVARIANEFMLEWLKGCDAGSRIDGEAYDVRQTAFYNGLKGMSELVSKNAKLKELAQIQVDEAANALFRNHENTRLLSENVVLTKVCAKLVKAAEGITANWETGDLAAAVNHLNEVVEAVKEIQAALASGK